MKNVYLTTEQKVIAMFLQVFYLFFIFVFLLRFQLCGYIPDLLYCNCQCISKYFSLRVF